MAVKRRTIWMDDETWQGIVDSATAQGLSPSQLIGRELRTPRMVVKMSATGVATPEDIEDAPALQAGAEGHLAEFERYNSRPFTPVPKRGTKG